MCCAIYSISHKTYFLFSRQCRIIHILTNSESEALFNLKVSLKNHLSPCKGVFEFYLIVSNIKNFLSFDFNSEMKFIKKHVNMVILSLVRVECSWISHHIFEIASTIVTKLFLSII